ncbi:MAG: crosslink repair DNA glycosylase YcaQ family protein [bacterium]
MQHSLTLRQARRVTLDALLLGPRPGLGRGNSAVLRAIEHLGYLQIDSIAVVNRAHHHTLWSRIPGYSAGGVYELLRKRQLFEYWGHAASFLPISDYRYYLPLMRSYRERPRIYIARSIQKHRELFPLILRKLETDGPLSSAEFGNEHGARGGSWWDWKPAKSALELLLCFGDVMVSERRGFQRVYDLRERVLPDGTDMREPDEEELAEFIIRRTLQAFGIARELEIRHMLRTSRLVDIRAALSRMLNSGELVSLSVEGLPGRNWYALPQLLDSLPATGRRRPRLAVLSPFDNLVILRERLQLLFGYDYLIECYVPEPKRRYGYFSLPLLYGEGFAGRLDAKARRREGVLELRALHLEEGFATSAEFERELMDGLRRFAEFNGCHSLELLAGGENVSSAMLQRLRRQA